MTAEGSPSSDSTLISPNFITEVIERDLAAGRYAQIVTRFPPEPNGYLHLGHVFASYLDFGTALDFGGRYHLRLDDTNPEGESMEYAQAIQDDLHWLGWDWGEHLYFASDHFELYYSYAEKLIELGAAYVDSVNGDEMARLRGSATQPGIPSVYRSRSIQENLDLFRRMRAGEFPDGAHVLRAKIDLSNPNMKLRDPVLYRIRRETHYRQGDAWCIYPMYDFQHPLQDATEGVTHSMCSLEFVDNRAIYDWLMETLGFEPRPHQYEFGRRNLEYTVVSKRKLRRLVEEGHVAGWDDPRMPTLRAQRRLGVTPEAVRTFAAGIGVNRTNRTVDLVVYENAVRNDLNHRAPRIMAVLEPLRLVIENLDEARELSLPYWPHDVVDASPDGLVALPDGTRAAPEAAVRSVPLSRELYIERSDFAVTPPPGFKRLTPGGRVRLRGAGIVQAERYELDAAGEPTVVYATLQPDGARASGVIHWVDAASAVPAEFRLYDRLFSVPNPEGQDNIPDFNPEEGGHEDTSEPVNTDFLRFLNPDSLRVTRGFVERSVQHDPANTRYQFERQGYFWQDPVDSKPDALVYGRIITLRDVWGAKGSEKPASQKATQPKAAPTRAAPKEDVPLSADQSAEAARLSALGISDSEAQLIARDEALSSYLRGLSGPHAAAVAGWAVNDLGAAIREGRAAVPLAALNELAGVLAGGSISTRIAREALAEAQESGGTETPAQIIERRGLKVVSDDSALEALIRAVMDENPAKVADYRGGKKGLSGFFTGQVMRRSNGQADPQRVAELMAKVLEG
ncbi:glutamine--tRNA ligase/YqeY domain fusion protein [Deinococcus ruber]|uniref:Glutamine--tRNA ligase n=1 Tax=Deinococcus ruber TaxID=1848197 RepID=A0A918EZT1_9DEIO|nr:glutamine--tRNA ligase/YqeY domain fusion protein [Deinococcus ruber]GGQ94848.1 glutamine--tRNA ligase [Deinococcus ruber]